MVVKYGERTRRVLGAFRLGCWRARSVLVCPCCAWLSLACWEWKPRSRAVMAEGFRGKQSSSALLLLVGYEMGRLRGRRATWQQYPTQWAASLPLLQSRTLNDPCVFPGQEASDPSAEHPVKMLLPAFVSRLYPWVVPQLFHWAQPAATLRARSQGGFCRSEIQFSCCRCGAEAEGYWRPLQSPGRAPAAARLHPAP